MTISLPPPELQIGFASRLSVARNEILQDALASVLKTLSVPEVDGELARFVPETSLSILASNGLRAELLFPVPVILKARPKLLGYYRLVLGYSQKAFYTRDTGIGRFKRMESADTISAAVTPHLNGLCSALCLAATQLLDGLHSAPLTARFLDELAVLTLGPQLRGGANNTIGQSAIVQVFNCIRDIVASRIESENATELRVRNAAGRIVVIRFAADPDIVIYEEMSAAAVSKKIAVEVKGGTDFSNIHNRIGEAEKSHQKARAAGYTECWTVINVEGLDPAVARSESPSTDRFYTIREITSGTGLEFQEFEVNLVSLIGMPNA